MNFSADLKRFHKKSSDKIVKVKKASAFDLFAAIVVGTPVRKGVLRNNWFVAMGQGSGERTTKEDDSPDGGAVISEIKIRLEATNLKDDVFFTNNLPYASRIEFDGYSGKAPEGMVRINAVRWEEFVEYNARRIARE